MKRWLLMALLCGIATAQTIMQDQNTNTWGLNGALTGTQLTFPDIKGTVTNQFEVKVNGTAPATLTVTIVGCMRGGTCSSTLATSSGTASQLMVPSSSNIYDNYKVTTSWTGGDATTQFIVNRTGTVARTGTIPTAGAAGNAYFAAAGNVISSDPGIVDNGNGTMTFGTNGGTGGMICLNGSTSNSVAISTAATGGIVDFGASCAQQSASANLGAKRLRLTGATTLVSGDFTLSAGWGTGPALAITDATSKDAAFVVTVTAGTTPGANPTVQLTFHDGTWTNVPVCLMDQSAGTGALPTGGQMVVTARSATSYTWQWTGTPSAAATYEFSGICMGT